MKIGRVIYHQKNQLMNLYSEIDPEDDEEEETEEGDTMPWNN